MVKTIRVHITNEQPPVTRIRTMFVRDGIEIVEGTRFSAQFPQRIGTHILLDVTQVMDDAEGKVYICERLDKKGT